MKLNASDSLGLPVLTLAFICITHNTSVIKHFITL